MTKIPMAAAVALMLGTPLAFAASSELPSPADLTTQHCSYLDAQMPSKGVTPYSAGTRQAAEEKAMSLCRQDRHKSDHAQRVGQPKPQTMFLARP